MKEGAVKREDIDRCRKALTELGGEATVEQIAEHAGASETRLRRRMPDVPGPTAQDPDIVLPFALPSAMDANVWRRGSVAFRSWDMLRISDRGPAVGRWRGAPNTSSCGSNVSDTPGKRDWVDSTNESSSSHEAARPEDHQEDSVAPLGAGQLRKGDQGYRA